MVSCGLFPHIDISSWYRTNLLLSQGMSKQLHVHLHLSMCILGSHRQLWLGKMHRVNLKLLELPLGLESWEWVVFSSGHDMVKTQFLCYRQFHDVSKGCVCIWNKNPVNFLNFLENGNAEKNLFLQIPNHKMI